MITECDDLDDLGNVNKRAREILKIFRTSRGALIKYWKDFDWIFGTFQER